jgi:hemolysin activation/secretion protein
VLKGTLDFARVLQSDRTASETHETLLGAGVGVELRLRRNLTVALDLGVPLENGRAIDVDTGDPELHFSFTALY